MIDIRAHVKALVDAAPPLTPEQVERIRAIVSGPPLRSAPPAAPVAVPDAA